MKKKQPKKPSYPKPIAKSAVLRFAATNHAARPMVFWEKARVWDWLELSRDENGNANTDLLLQRVRELNLHFSDDNIADNKRSTAFVIKATVPTQREWLRLCEKYGYDSDLEETVTQDE